MNNGRIWCVVKPTVGLPLFLGGVAVISLTVHGSVMTNTTWMADFFQGSKARRADAAPVPAHLAAAHVNDSNVTVSVMPVAGLPGDTTAFVVTITPKAGGSAQTVMLHRPEVTDDGTGSSAAPPR
ncbi:light-harvesting protein [Elioraea sp.]|uniref:light-harvesting protein n=1 Tax=Elioraea sp. TaxID=2185103 RepID=UPI0025BDAD72|nr:light-harvesting protein [Elioraea sp.]